LIARWATSNAGCTATNHNSSSRPARGFANRSGRLSVGSSTQSVINQRVQVPIVTTLIAMQCTGVDQLRTDELLQEESRGGGRDNGLSPIGREMIHNLGKSYA
jgi:hypothetical protein